MKKKKKKKKKKKEVGAVNGGKGKMWEIGNENVSNNKQSGHALQSLPNIKRSEAKLFSYFYTTKRVEKKEGENCF